MAVADTFDAMTTDRTYRKGMSSEKALEVLGEVKGTQLDARLVDVFVQILMSKNEKGKNYSIYKTEEKSEPKGN